MPNWCNNTVTITGQSGVLACLVAIAGETTEEGLHHIDFSKIIPPPEDSTLGWRVKNWGTKWNATESLVCCERTSDGVKEIPITDQEAHFWFDTAWSPPFPVIDALGRQFPDLTFELGYCEDGMCFHGTYCVRGDTILRHDWEEWEEDENHDRIITNASYWVNRDGPEHGSSFAATCPADDDDVFSPGSDFPDTYVPPDRPLQDAVIELGNVALSEDEFRKWLWDSEMRRKVSITKAMERYPSLREEDFVKAYVIHRDAVIASGGLSFLGRLDIWVKDWLGRKAEMSATDTAAMAWGWIRYFEQHGKR